MAEQSAGGGPIGTVEVEIRARLGALEADLAKAIAMLKRFDDEQRKTTQSATALEKAFGGVRGQLTAIAAGAGPVGVFLSSLGPWGFAAAVGLGATEKVLGRINEQGRLLGGWASQIQNTSQVIQAGVGPVVALTRAADDLGITTEQVQGWLFRLSYSLEQVKTGTGPLADGLAKVDAQLLIDIQQAKTFTEKWDILAKALKATPDPQSILRPLLGRGGAGAIRLFNYTEDAGGLNKVNDEMRKTNALTDSQLGRVAELSKRIKSMAEDNKLVWASVWGETALERSLIATENERKFAAITKDITKDMGAAKTLAVEFMATMANMAPVEVQGRLVAQMEKMQRIARERRQPTTMGPSNVAQPGFALPKTVAELRAEVDKLSKSNEEVTTTAETAVQAYSNFSRVIGILGETVTITEQRDLALKKLNLDLAANNNLEALGLGFTNESIKARREQAIALKFETDMLTTRMGVLGSAISLEEQLLAINQKVRAAQQLGASLTKEQIKGIEDRTRAQYLGIAAMEASLTSLQIERQSLGMSLAAATAYRLAEEQIAKMRRDGVPDVEKHAAAIRAAAAAVGAETEALAKLKLQKDIAFERSTLFLMDEEAQIASRLREHYASIPEALASAEAAQIRFNNALKDAMSNTTSFAQGFVRDIMNGVTATQALSNALKSLGGKLIDKGIEGAVKSAFGGVFGGGDKGIAVRGSTPATPVFVSVVGPGGIPGVGDATGTGVSSGGTNLSGGAINMFGKKFVPLDAQESAAFKAQSTDTLTRDDIMAAPAAGATFGSTGLVPNSVKTISLTPGTPYTGSPVQAAPPMTTTSEEWGPVYDPFKTKVQGKDQDRLPVGPQNSWENAPGMGDTGGFGDSSMTEFNTSLTKATESLGTVPEVTGNMVSGLTQTTTQLSTFTGEGLTPAVSALTNYSNTALTSAATQQATTTASVTTLGTSSAVAATEISTLGSAAAAGGVRGGIQGVAIPFSPFAEGGWIPGTGPILAHENEFVVNPKQSKKFGPLLEAINEDRVMMPSRKDGGWVGNAVRAAAGTTGQPSNAAPPPASRDPSVRVINSFDPISFLQQALGSREGERVVLNFIQANPGAIKRLLA